MLPPLHPLRMLAALLACAAPALAQTPGSAFVLNRFGQHVPGNSFPRSDAVYLTGGPGAGCLAAGLADGDWCFQITDPAGTVLLTPDPIAQRTVRVAGGVVAQYLGTTRVGANNAPCGAFNLRLAPFLATPYPTREYKIWLTRVEDYDAGGAHLFGFDPALSKSDNFRVQASGAQSILIGAKFFDHDENGAWNPGTNPLEVAIGGWRVELLRNGVVDGATFTDQDGRYLFVRDQDGSTWDVREISPNGFINDATPGATWLATRPRTGTVATTAEYVAAPDFGNVSYELLPGGGRSWQYWSEMNGEGMAVLEGCDTDWRIALNEFQGGPVSLRRPVSNDNPPVSIFTVMMPPQTFTGAFANWKSYVRLRDRDHAGFLLSREIGATLLNNSCGFMQGSIYVDRFGDGVLVSLEDMLAGAIGLLRQTGAGLTGPNDPYQDLRMHMLMCLNEFGTINNTGDPSSPQVVYQRSKGPTLFESPY